MALVSVLTPAMSISNLGQIESVCRDTLGTTDYQLYKLVPLEQGETTDHVIIKLNTSFSLKAVEDLIRNNEMLQTQLTKSKEAIRTFSIQLDKMKTSLNLTRSQRIKKLEEENTKLRRALQ
jgi:hypothetical protein